MTSVIKLLRVYESFEGSTLDFGLRIESLRKNSWPFNFKVVSPSTTYSSAIIYRDSEFAAIVEEHFVVANKNTLDKLRGVRSDYFCFCGNWSVGGEVFDDAFSILSYSQKHSPVSVQGKYWEFINMPIQNNSVRDLLLKWWYEHEAISTIIPKEVVAKVVYPEDVNISSISLDGTEKVELSVNGLKYSGKLKGTLEVVQ